MLISDNHFRQMLTITLKICDQIVDSKIFNICDKTIWPQGLKILWPNCYYSNLKKTLKTSIFVIKLYSYNESEFCGHTVVSKSFNICDKTV